MEMRLMRRSTKRIAPRVMLIIDPETRVFDADGTTGHWSPGDNETTVALVRYLALVAELRGVPEQSRFRIRSADIEVLGKAFEMSPRDMRRRLKELQTDSRVLVARRTLRGSVLLPAGGLLLTATALGGLVLVDVGAAYATGAQTPTTAIERGTPVFVNSGGTYEIADAIAVTRASEGTYEIADAIAVTRPTEGSYATVGGTYEIADAIAVTRPGS